MIKNKKGFTLVELLAVIVVLGIIALIGYSAVGNVIETAKKKADALSVANYAKAISQKYLTDKMLGKEIGIGDSDINYVDANGIIDPEALETAINFNGNKPSIAAGFISNEGEVSLFGCTGQSNNNKFSYVNGQTIENNSSSNSINSANISKISSQALTNIRNENNLYTAKGSGGTSTSGTLATSRGELKIEFNKSLLPNKNYQLTLNTYYLTRGTDWNNTVRDESTADQIQIYFYGSNDDARTSFYKPITLNTNNLVTDTKTLTFELNYIKIRFNSNELGIDLNSLKIEEV